MKVAHINISDSVGGASMAALRLHRAMSDSGVESRLFVLRRGFRYDSRISSVGCVEEKFTSKLRYLATRFLSRGAKSERGLFSADFGSSSIASASNFIGYDAIYIHWINHGLMSLKALEKILKLNIPVFWVCHDMWALTGGCHHSFECKRFQTECHSCPSLGSQGEDYSTKLFNRKKELYKKYNNLHFIAISPFMNDVILSSGTTSHSQINLIPNALNITEFDIRDKYNCRKELNLPQDKFLILFGADMGARNPYKGWNFAKDAILRFVDKYKDRVHLVLFGASEDSYLASQYGIPCTNLGEIKSEYTMVSIYNAVDLYLNPSIAESLSYTTMEASSCGTPTVAFNVGGIPSIIFHKVNGYLADVGSVDSLVDGMEWVYNIAPDTSEQLRAQVCHLAIEQKFDSLLIATRHINLIKSL